ncbi:hypothetical protein SARC_04826 [Sphaeroforma arctica JP610]|uniref:PX domain-containing protein n=1 Tax=Sphaeroforma arctica JP610 TaxID=667725 RepID=A0A0L0G251_9EUKA|nr:hypothetical protein SARC_04826 [Sphaeroforma arctica JP610]KNC82906.1 hypothetical protein SARC_04826 [Sphaeroforma arctica JP610]|eukprot:XP_014156808.1 hypothetical protein SARC_04826 [Sphaeroforma arctica JP610]
MKTEATVSIVNEQKRNMECMAKTVELAEVLHAPHIVTLSRALLGQLKIDEVSTVKTKRQGSYIHFFNDGVMLSRSFKMSISSRSAKILLSPTKYECIKLRKIGKVKAPSGEVEYHIVIEAPYQSLKHKRTFACRTEQDYVQIETFFAEKGKGPPVKSDPSNSRNGTGSPKRPKKGSPTDSEVPKNNNPAPNINRRMAKVITRSEVAYSGDFSKAELSKLERTKSSPAGPTSGCRIVTSTGIAVDPDYIKISGCARDAADPFTFLYKIHIGKTANQYIYRSYDDFFAMHVQICAEYATLRSAESILPELIPPRTTLSEEAAMDLQQPLAQYLIDIINLPRLSNSLSIIESFLVSPSDVNPEARMAQNVQELPLAPFPWGQCGDNV